MVLIGDYTMDKGNDRLLRENAVFLDPRDRKEKIIIGSERYIQYCYELAMIVSDQISGHPDIDKGVNFLYPLKGAALIVKAMEYTLKRHGKKINCSRPIIQEKETYDDNGYYHPSHFVHIDLLDDPLTNGGINIVPDDVCDKGWTFSKTRKKIDREKRKLRENGCIVPDSPLLFYVVFDKPTCREVDFDVDGFVFNTDKWLYLPIEGNLPDEILIEHKPEIARAFRLIE